MKLPNSEQTSRPWRIHELVRDFDLLDVWALPTPGGPNDFPKLVEIFSSADTADTPSATARALWAIRWKLGELFGWDDMEEDEVPDRELLRDRLPADLRKAPPGPGFDTLPFKPVYLLDDEWAAEVINKTVHGDAPLLGAGRAGPVSRADVGLRQTERPLRPGLPRRDRTVPAPRRLSADAARVGAALASAGRRGS